MTYKQGMSLVMEAANFGLDMQSQVHICVDGTRENWYPAVDCEMPPHIALWTTYETHADFMEYLVNRLGYAPMHNYNVLVPDSATGDEFIYFFYLRDDED